MSTTGLQTPNLEVAMNAASRFAVPGIVFLLTLASGLWLSRTGRPLNSAIFTVHKLIALVAVITVAAKGYNELKLAGPHAVFSALLVLAALCVVALFATGALMSMNKLAQATLQNVHKAAVVLAVIIWPLALFVLARVSA
jgi:hypothetical protein